MLTHVKNFYKENRFLTILLLTTFVLVLSTGIIFHQNWLKMLPIFISLIIMVLSARVNRYSLLLGSFNSLIYCYYYYSVGLMSNLWYAVLVSFPLQLISFFTWHRKSKGSITELKKMSWLQRILAFVIVVIFWACLLFVTTKIEGASHSIFDTVTTTLGIVVTVLVMLRFSEYAVLQVISGTISIIMHATIFLEGNYANITYLIFSIYSLICVIMALIRMHKTHRHIIANRNNKKAV